MFTLPDIPDSIDRAKVVEFAESLGFDAKNLRSLDIRLNGVHVEVFHRNAAGHQVIEAGHNETVVHTIFIPFEAHPEVSE